MKPSQRKEMAQQVVASRGVSIRLACSAFQVSERCYRYQPIMSSENAELAEWRIQLTEQYSDWGFGLCFAYIRNVKGFAWNHKQVYRIYCELALNLRIEPMRRLTRNKPEPLKEPLRPDQVWPMAFIHDQLFDGRSCRLFNVIDDYRQQGIAIEAGFSLPSIRVIRVLNQLLESGGKSRRSFAVTTGRSSSATSLHSGYQRWVYVLNISSLVSHSRMHTLREPTPRYATAG